MPSHVVAPAAAPPARALRPREMLAHVAHRPWVLARPNGWVMHQTWNDLLFAHWPVPAATLRPLISAGLELDTYDGGAWVGLVPFRMSGIRPRYTAAVPGLSAFPQLNMRTYVRCGDRPGVCFFSLDAANPLAAWGARTFFHLPYHAARMHVVRDGETVRYHSLRRGQSGRGEAHAEFVADYRPVAPTMTAQPGTLEHFLAERYCLYCWDAGGRLYRSEIHHAAWPLHRAEADVRRNTLFAAAGIALPDVPPLLHYAGRMQVLFWPFERVR